MTHDWNRTLRRLEAYAANRIRRLVRVLGTSRVEPSELAQDAVDAYLSGARAFDESKCDLDCFLRGIVRSRISMIAKKFERGTDAQATEDDVMERGALKGQGFRAPYGTERLAIQIEESVRFLDRLWDLCGTDFECVALVDAVMEGKTKREELAATLGWDPERVTTVRVRLQRKLAASGYREPNRRVRMGHVAGRSSEVGQAAEGGGGSPGGRQASGGVGGSPEGQEAHAEGMGGL